MKNVPKKIFLQIGDEDLPEDFNDLYDVSWCSERIYGNDIEYVLEPSIVTDSLHIDFAIYLTGHDRDTIEQMYNDWKR